ncbi:NAD+ kinase, partial [Phenoliferia sp. Uapishka_3]
MDSTPVIIFLPSAVTPVHNSVRVDSIFRVSQSSSPNSSLAFKSPTFSLSRSSSASSTGSTRKPPPHPLDLKNAGPRSAPAPHEAQDTRQDTEEEHNQRTAIPSALRAHLPLPRSTDEMSPTAGSWVADQRARSPLAGPPFNVETSSSSRLPIPQVTHRNVSATSAALSPSHSHTGVTSSTAAPPLVSRSPSVGSPCFVHSHLDNSLSGFINKKDSQAAALRRKKSTAAALGSKGKEPAAKVNGVAESSLEEDSDTASEGKCSNDDVLDDGEEEGPSLTRQLAETAVSVREMSKQLGRARVVSHIQSVMIITKARDNHLIRLTRELALWLMQTPRNGRDRGLVVYVDTQLRKSKRFDAEGMQREHPELFRPLPRRYSRTSSSTSLSSAVLDPAAKRMAPLSQLNEALKRSASPEFMRKPGHGGDDDQGQLRYWTNAMCTEKPHLFDFVVTLGGDGTVLYASWLFQHIVPPVIPFALGSLGFLTGFDFPKYAQVMNSAIDDGIRVNLRMRFTCTVYRAVEGEENKKRRAVRSGKTGGIFMNSLTKDGWEAIESGGTTGGSRRDMGKKDREIKCFSTRPVESFEVLNDLVVDRGPSPYVSLLELFGDEHHMTTVQADGLTVSTPTGSTAYSLSAGGSLVHPEVPALLITPICPHTLSFRPMLLPDSMELRICVPYNSRSTAWASFDGRGRVELRQGDHIKVTASQYPFPTVCADNQSTDWFQAIARTLKWNERQRQKSFVILEEGRKKPKQDGRVREAGEKVPAATLAARAQENFGDEEDDEEEDEDDEEDSEEDEGEETYDIDDLSSENPTTSSSPVSGPTDPVVNGDIPILISRALSSSSTELDDPRRQSSTASSIDLHDEDRFQVAPPRPPRLSSRHSVSDVPKAKDLASPPTISHNRMSSSTSRRRERGEEGDRDHIHEPLNVKRNVGGGRRGTATQSKEDRSSALRNADLSEGGDQSEGRAFAVVGVDSDTSNNVS